MSSPNKITFGNTTGTTYTIGNNSNFGYTTGDYIQPAASTYQPQSTTVYGGTTSTYQPYTENREVAYGAQQVNQNYTVPTAYSSVLAGNQTGVTYGAVQDIARPAPVTKITFGGKQFTETINTRPVYETAYVAPVTTYQTYTQPTQIHTITSQPIRQQVRYQQVIQPKQVQVREQFVSNVPAPVVEKKKTKKSGCPSWIWYLLGALLLLGLIVGLIFLFKNLGGSTATPTIVTNGTSTTTGTTNATVDGTTGTTFVTPTIDTNVTTPTIPTSNITIPTPNITIPTPNITIPTITTPTWTDDSSVDPTPIAPIPVTTTSTYTTTTPTTYTSTTGTTSADYSASGYNYNTYPTTTTGTTSADYSASGYSYSYNTYPATTGYGSNPVYSTVSTNYYTPATDVYPTAASYAYVQPTSVY